MKEKEHLEGVALMRWVNGFRTRPGAILKWPQLKWFHHIPNGGKRHRTTAGKLKAEGVKAGVADYFLPWASPVSFDDHYFYHGLYLELKAPGYTYPTAEQKEFLADMAAAGYAVAWRRGASECIEVLTAYLEGKWINETEMG